MRLCKDKRRLYRRVRRTLGKTTPLRADCGVLCEKRCCKGDGETGMLMFPGEVTALPVRIREARRLAVCEGNCNREERPLSCRLFPLLPMEDEKGNVCVVIDKRGVGICPLIEHENEVVFSQRFLHRVKKAGKLLFADAECRAFLEQCSEESRQTAQMIETFLKK